MLSRPRRYVTLIAAALFGAGSALAAETTDATTRDVMHKVYDAIAYLLPLSVRDAEQASSWDRELIDAKLATLDQASDALLKHAQGKDEEFRYLARSFDETTRDIVNSFRETWPSYAYFSLMELTQHCVACHSRLPSEAQAAFGSGATIVRPGLIVGPGDLSDRFSYWPVRIDKGGEILAPGTPSDPVQYIDAHDLSEWIVRLGEAHTMGTFNATGPKSPTNIAEMLYGIKAVTSSDAKFTFVPADFLAQHQVLHVRARDQPAVPPAEAARDAEVEEAFDLLVDAADGLHLAQLVDRPRDREALVDGHAGQRGQQGAEFGERGAVAVDAPVGLFEHEAGGHRQRHACRIARGEEIGQDEDALGVQRATEFGLAFDVDHAAVTEPRERRDARGQPEREAVGLDDRQAVDLTAGLALGRDQPIAAHDLFEHALADAADALTLPRQRLAQMIALDHLRAGHARAVVRLADHVRDRVDRRRQAFGIVGQPRGVFDQAAHRRSRERPRARLVHEPGAEACEGEFTVRGSRHFVFEIDDDLEEVPEFGIVTLEDIQQPALADQADFHVERNRRRIQRRSGEETELGFGRVEPDLSRAQRTLQRLPRERLHQQLARIEHEEAAVGAMQGARLEQGEVRDEGAERRAMLDTADQVAERRQVTPHDGRGIERAVVDEEIDRVALEHAFELHRVGARRQRR